MFLNARRGQILTQLTEGHKEQRKVARYMSSKLTAHLVKIAQRMRVGEFFMEP